MGGFIAVVIVALAIYSITGEKSAVQNGGFRYSLAQIIKEIAQAIIRSL